MVSNNNYVFTVPIDWYRVTSISYFVISSHTSFDKNCKSVSGINTLKPLMLHLKCWSWSQSWKKDWSWCWKPSCLHHWCFVALVSGVTNDVLTGAAGFNKTHVQVHVFSLQLIKPIMVMVTGFRLQWPVGDHFYAKRGIVRIWLLSGKCNGIEQVRNLQGYNRVRESCYAWGNAGVC